MWQTKYASPVPKIFGCSVKAISSLGVRSQCLNNVKYKQKSFSFTIVVIKKTMLNTVLSRPYFYE